MLADNPIGYWRLGESSGTASDSSGNGRHGTYMNGVALGALGALTGDSDTSARFDGVNDSVQVPDDTALRLNASWSIEFWARQNTFAHTSPGSSPRAMPQRKTATPSGRTRAVSSSSSANKKLVGSGLGALTSAFRHFVVTYDGSALRWYVNGALSTTKKENYPENKGKASLELGRGADYGNNDLDEVAIYATALSTARIAAHYTAGS